MKRTMLEDLAIDTADFNANAPVTIPEAPITLEQILEENGGIYDAIAYDEYFGRNVLAETEDDIIDRLDEEAYENMIEEMLD